MDKKQKQNAIRFLKILGVATTSHIISESMQKKESPVENAYQIPIVMNTTLNSIAAIMLEYMLPQEKNKKMVNGVVNGLAATATQYFLTSLIFKKSTNEDKQIEDVVLKIALTPQGVNKAVETKAEEKGVSPDTLSNDEIDKALKEFSESTESDAFKIEVHPAFLAVTDPENLGMDFLDMLLEGHASANNEDEFSYSANKAQEIVDYYGDNLDKLFELFGDDADQINPYIAYSNDNTSSESVFKDIDHIFRLNRENVGKLMNDIRIVISELHPDQRIVDIMNGTDSEIIAVLDMFIDDDGKEIFKSYLSQHIQSLIAKDEEKAFALAKELEEKLDIYSILNEYVNAR